jgi:hypothetical protein
MSLFVYLVVRIPLYNSLDTGEMRTQQKSYLHSIQGIHTYNNGVYSRKYYWATYSNVCISQTKNKNHKPSPVIDFRLSRDQDQLLRTCHYIFNSSHNKLVLMLMLIQPLIDSYLLQNRSYVDTCPSTRPTRRDQSFQC